MNLTIFEFDEFEKTSSATLFHSRYDYIIGCDEAGRGPGAGAVFAAAVCFKNFDGLGEILHGLNDSKKLSEKTREKLFPLIKENSFYSIVSTEVDKIEEINILNASLLSMKEAVQKTAKNLNSDNILVLVDGNRKIKNLEYDQKDIIKGDSTSASIAAASILAKVSRDNYMKELDKKFPDYNFKKNKGYLTKEHIEAIKKYGITKFHRKSFLQKIIL